MIQTPHHLAQLRKRPEGKLVATSVTNEIVDAVNAGAYGGLHGQNHDEILANAGGFWAEIVRTGPQGTEDDFMDDRYWVKACRITNDETDGNDANVTFKTIDDDEAQDYQVVVASNLAESVSRGHMLPKDLVVRVVGLEDTGDPSKLRYVFSSGTPEIWMKITGSAAVPGKTNLWAYTWTQQQYLRTGLWQDFPGALTDASEKYGGKAYNTIEANNSASGIYGNSIDAASLGSGFSIQAVRGTPIVRAFRIFSCDDPPVGEWVFSYENAVQGACP